MLHFFNVLLFPGTEFSRNLEEDLINDTSGDFQRILVSQVQGHRAENEEVNVAEATQDAVSLLEVSNNRFIGTESAAEERMKGRAN